MAFSKEELLKLFSIILAGSTYDHKKAHDESNETLNEAEQQLDAKINQNAVERIRLRRGEAARLHAQIDLDEGGSVFKIKNAPCQSTVYVDGHLAGTVWGCEKTTRYGQTEVSESEFLVSIPPKKDKTPYVLSVKHKGFKTFEQQVLKPDDKRGLVEVDAAMQKL